jgi:hypothetical protein
MANIEIMDHGNGLVTVGLASEADKSCDSAHQAFLAEHKIPFWQLIVLRVVDTRYIFVFSGATGKDEPPNHTLTDASVLTTRIGEILNAHYEQTHPGGVPAGPR